ncbi:MAG: AraC family transcriptional regulator, partial [Candidatus Dormibacteria bacterium]
MLGGSVAVIAFAGISPFHLSVPCLVFGEDRSADGIPPYDLRVCGTEGHRSVPTSGGFCVTPEYGMEGLRGMDTIIVPSWRSPQEPPPTLLLNGLRAAHQNGARIVGLCLGAFVVAGAGLLDGRQATTHWRYAAELAQQYPAVQVDSDRLWVDLDDVITSAGTAAAIDCCLHLVRRDHGSEVANRLARRLVVAPHRSG